MEEPPYRGNKSKTCTENSRIPRQMEEPPYKGNVEDLDSATTYIAKFKHSRLTGRQPIRWESIIRITQRTYLI